MPPAQVEQFFEKLVPSEADKLARAGDEESLRKALELDARNAEAARRLGRLLLARGEADEALAVLDRIHGDYVAEGLVARARLTATEGDGAGPSDAFARAFAAWDGGDYEGALEALQEALAATDDSERRDLIRKVMVAMFTELGADHPVAREHRRRLAVALH